MTREVTKSAPASSKRPHSKVLERPPLGRVVLGSFVGRAPTFLGIGSGFMVIIAERPGGWGFDTNLENSCVIICTLHVLPSLYRVVQRAGEDHSFRKRRFHPKLLEIAHVLFFLDFLNTFGDRARKSGGSKEPLTPPVLLPGVDV